MAGAASQAGNADSRRAPGLASGLQGSVNVHRGALLLVPQCSSFEFYIQLLGKCHCWLTSESPSRSVYLNSVDVSVSVIGLIPTVSFLLISLQILSSIKSTILALNAKE